MRTDIFYAGELLYAAMPRGILAACYAHMGRLDDARMITGRLRAITCV